MVEAGYRTQVDLANAADLTPLTVNRVVRGRTALTVEVAAKLAPVLRRPVAWLMFGDAPEAPVPSGPHPTVGQYLASEFGADVAPHVANLLKSLDYRSIGLADPGIKDVHRVRELLELNLAIARKRHA